MLISKAFIKAPRVHVQNDFCPILNNILAQEAFIDKSRSIIGSILT